MAEYKILRAETEFALLQKMKEAQLQGFTPLPASYNMVMKPVSIMKHGMGEKPIKTVPYFSIMAMKE